MTDKDQQDIIHMMFDGLEECRCLECGAMAYIYYDRAYKGRLGMCTRCDIQWRED